MLFDHEYKKELRKHFPILKPAKVKRFVLSNLIVGLVVTFLLIVSWTILSSSAEAEITEERAIHCILGEARLEYIKGDSDALLYHAEALRNRIKNGLGLKGVYGCKDRWGRSEQKYKEDVNYCKIKGLFEAAKEAWRQSEYTNHVKGADHWGSLTIDGEWIKTMERKGFVRTALTKCAAFYKKS